MLVQQGALRKSAAIRRFVAISIVKWVVLYLKYRTWLTFLSRYQVGGAKKNSADHWLVKWSRGLKKSWLASRLSGRKNPKGLSRRAVSSHNPGHLLFVCFFCQRLVWFDISSRFTIRVQPQTISPRLTRSRTTLGSWECIRFHKSQTYPRPIDLYAPDVYQTYKPSRWTSRAGRPRDRNATLPRLPSRTPRHKRLSHEL